MNVLKNSSKMLLGLAVVLGMSLASAAKAAETGSVKGKVLDMDGKGAAGAKVRLVADTGGGKKKGDAPATLQAQGEKPKPVAEADAGADGTFELKDVPAGNYRVNAMVKGQGRASAKVAVKAGETAEVTLTLKPNTGGKKGAK